jgi:hypothetical protein
MCAWGTRYGRCVNGRRFTDLVVTQSNYCLKQLAAIPDSRNPQILEVFCRQIWQDGRVNFVLAECRLVFFEAAAAQPPTDVHDGARWHARYH